MPRVNVWECEAKICRLRDAGDLASAATVVIEGYGPEVLGFLVTMLGSEPDAEEVFADACEDLWRGWAGFEARASARTWFYALARHSAARFRRAPARRAERRIPLSEAIEPTALPRSHTPIYRRTDIKNQLAALRASLDESERELLVLRVDRGMTWPQIARVLSPADVAEATIEQLAARLRKRFQLLREQLHRRADRAAAAEWAT